MTSESRIALKKVLRLINIGTPQSKAPADMLLPFDTNPFVMQNRLDYEAQLDKAAKKFVETWLKHDGGGHCYGIHED